DVALKPNNVFSIEYDQITGDLYSLVDVSGLNAAKGVWRRNTDGTIDHVISEGADFSFNPASSISQFAPIPEPSRALLLLLGLGAVLVRRRRM
ncbi:MAG: PEP-CTERM sorting domain-containing protein, partial [Pirellulales bacterium]